MTTLMVRQALDKHKKSYYYEIRARGAKESGKKCPQDIPIKLLMEWDEVRAKLNPDAKGLYVPPKW